MTRGRGRRRGKIEVPAGRDPMVQGTRADSRPVRLASLPELAKKVQFCRQLTGGYRSGE